MTEPILINIVSGKGGTGKTLLTTVLARMLAQEKVNVLVVDCDLFVRGLSFFYYLYDEKRLITKKVTVADFYGLNGEISFTNSDFANERFYEVDILPAVAEVNKKLDYLVIEDKTVEKTRHLLNILKSKEYDYIIIDNRAGVDELIIETSKSCDLTISVSESDLISKYTNENIIAHLQDNDSETQIKIYTIINKIKFIQSFDEYQTSVDQIRGDFGILGHIPFDVDLFEQFGTKTFWDYANSTRYAYSLAETWNNLAKKEELKHTIDMKRFPKNELWPGGIQSPVFLNRFERLSTMFGFTLLFLYLVYDLVFYDGQNVTFNFKPEDSLIFYSILMFSVPIMRSFFYANRCSSSSTKQQWWKH